MVNLQSFAGELGDDLLNGGGFVQLNKLASPPASPVRLRRRIERQKLLLRVGIEEIEVGVLLMKTPNGFLVVKIMVALIISLPNLDELIGELPLFRFPFREE